MGDLVRGEASESDDEENQFTAKKAAVLASEIKGEDSESDSENELFSKETHTSPTRNVLQQLLIKNNAAIWNDLNLYVNRIVSESTRPLLSMEHLLIKTQMTFSSMLSSLKIAQNNVKNLHVRARDTFTGNYISNIKMD